MVPYLLIGMVVIAVLVAVLFLIFRKDIAKIDDRMTGRQFLLLGIVFLVPGLISLFLDGETSVFLSLGAIFTFSGLVSRYLLEPATFPGYSVKIRTGALIGLLTGSVIGAALSIVFGYPSVIATVFSAALGVLIGAMVGVIYLRSHQT